MAWNGLFPDIQAFKQQWGHCDVPQKYAKNQNLGLCVNQQRCQYRLLKSGNNSFISDERMAQLEYLDFNGILEKIGTYHGLE